MISIEIAFDESGWKATADELDDTAYAWIFERLDLIRATEVTITVRREREVVFSITSTPAAVAAALRMRHAAKESPMTAIQEAAQDIAARVTVTVDAAQALGVDMTTEEASGDVVTDRIQNGTDACTRRGQFAQTTDQDGTFRTTMRVSRPGNATGWTGVGFLDTSSTFMWILPDQIA